MSSFTSLVTLVKSSIFLDKVNIITKRTTRGKSLQSLERQTKLTYPKVNFSLGIPQNKTKEDSPRNLKKEQIKLEGYHQIIPIQYKAYY
jgi:hypothetical protein